MTARALVLLFALAVATRVAAVAVLGLVLRGDYPVYALVAENILNGCGVSLSPPGAACVPHFGGNGLPGYPAFIAAAWTLLGHGNAAVIWSQVAVCSAAVPLLGFAVGRMAGGRVGLAAGLVAALSPLDGPLVRYGLAEALTVAAAEALIAALALSVAAGRLRVLAVAAPLGVAIALRLDSVLYTLPVAVFAVRLHGWGRGVLRCALVGAVLAVPLAGWTARNLAAGLDVVPPARGWMLPDGSVGPLGYLAWLKQWVTTEPQRAAAAFFNTDRYDRIHFLPGPFWPAAQTERADALLTQLKDVTGHPFPPEIDAAFAALAQEAAAARSWPETALLRLDQAWALWRNWTEPASPSPARFPAGLCRSGLGLAFVVAVALRRGGAFTLAALLLIAGKTVLAVSGLFLESRYTWTVVPFLEITVVLALTASRRARTR